MHYYTTTKNSHTELGLPVQKLYLGELPKAVCLATCVALKFQDSLLKKCLCIMAKINNVLCKGVQSKTNSEQTANLYLCLV